MKNSFKSLSRRFRLSIVSTILGIAGVIYFGPLVHSAPNLNVSAPKLQTKSITKIVSQPVLPKGLPRSVPTYLRIPKINLSTSLQPVGLAANGTLEVPADFHIAGWYQRSPSPGEIGPAILDGHVDNVKGLGIFWYLRELQPGDIIEVDRNDGLTIKFNIDAVKQYPQDQVPINDVYGNISYAGIRLITCGGVFNRQTRHYTDNIVVFGTLIN